MKVVANEPPRIFEAGYENKAKISDCGRIILQADEQVTFLTTDGKEYDVARKSWGYYATPSLNSRLESFGLRGVLVRNRDDRYYVLLVESGKEQDFMAYVEQEPLRIVCWLDSTQALNHLAESLKNSDDGQIK